MTEVPGKSGRRGIAAALVVLSLLLAGSAAQAQDLPAGQVLHAVQGLNDPTISYSLYLPKAYTPDRDWPVLLGFHFEARGGLIVEKYREAAERYGYIVAGSNVSRNGDWNRSVRAAEAMVNEIGRRFAVDPARVYATGLSGGSRLAMALAISTNKFAGVIASSAGLPDGETRRTLKFPVYMTAGYYDFNYLEMRNLDRTLKSPHRLALFAGGHVLPTDEVAMRAIEWMELHAMAAGLRPTDPEFVAYLWTRREEAVAAAGETPEGVRQLRAAADDFRRIGDVKAIESRANALARRADVKAAIERERRNDLAEAELVESIVRYEVELSVRSKRNDGLAALRQIVSDLRRKASQPASPERERALRVLEIITYEPGRRVWDAEYLKVLLDAAPSLKSD